MSLEKDSHISLIDLSKQFNFRINEKNKEQLCFSETLIVSCAHYEGDCAESDDEDDEAREGFELESTCTATTTSEVVEEEPKGPIEIKDYVEEAQEEQEPEEDDDFHFYFFPDCTKPPPKQHSKSSLIIGPDGIPRVNEAAKDPTYCKCEKDKKEKCSCFVILPCKCGAKTKQECTCAKATDICICDELNPAPVCVCGKAQVCTCYPGYPRPICVCDQVQKPCICFKDKFPSPVCTCKKKPKWPGGIDPRTGTFKEDIEAESIDESKTSYLWGEHHGEEHVVEESNISQPQKSNIIKIEEEESRCECQKPDPKERCFCIKGKGRKCICKEDECICGVQDTCVCEPPTTPPVDVSSNDDPDASTVTPDSKTLCECPKPKECTCDEEGLLCTCFPKPQVCTCDDPEECKCTKICDCTEPCICDTKPKECICLDKTKQLQEGLVCTCSRKKEGVRKLKKVRAGKHGYRWCHDVDPHHTYFDYAYGRHDKISCKEQEKEKFKILGLHHEKEDEVCPIHSEPPPPVFEKKVRKPSMDCCSSVGGITVNVETLGEDADKFLIQIVCRASKEGAKIGSKLVSIIDLNLHTLEENRDEHIIKKGRAKERKSYMAICQSGYYNKVTRNCGERSVIKRLYHSFEEAKDFLLEGANIVLMRYLAIQRYKGTIKTVTVLLDGTVCQSVYVCPGTSQAIVNGKPLYVVKIERHIIHPNGYIHKTLTTMSLKGYIITNEWADNNYVVHINPLLRVNPDTDDIEHHAPLREKWREDLQLMSDFLDFKTTRSSEGARYVAESGRLTNTIRDYLQAILLLKPQDVVHFTRHYFHSALSSLDLPRDDYFDSCAKHVRYYYLED